jgi:CubicO group peptidase (beta-lactamase class C family)
LLLVLAVSTIALLSHGEPKPRPLTGLEAICKDHDLPALAVVVTRDGQICDRAVAGVRKWGDSTPVTTNDLLHIGSCTKSMTATLAAIFIEQGKLRWDTTIAEAFPEFKGRMDKSYETVTVEQLLHHRGGVPSAPPPAAWQRAWQEIGTPTEQRREFIEAVLSAPPAAPQMIYSSEGYVIVGAILEKISGRDFESLMTEKLFKPLHMDSAGFGAPGTKGKIDQPWGHVRMASITLPMQKDNPPVHSPAGRVHCSLDDLARYSMFHLQRGPNGLLKPETMARLHASPDGVEIKDPMDNYACGWVRLQSAIDRTPSGQAAPPCGTHGFEHPCGISAPCRACAGEKLLRHRHHQRSLATTRRESLCRGDSGRHQPCIHKCRWPYAPG